MNKWFTNNNGQVKGPFSPEEISQMVQAASANEAALSAIYIWTRGYAEWIRADKWSPHMVTAVAQIATPRENVNPNTPNPKINSQPQAKLQIPGAPNPAPKIVKQDSPPQVTQIATKVSLENSNSFSKDFSDTKPDMSAGPKKTKYKVQYNFQNKGEMTIDEIIKFSTAQESPEKVAIYDEQDQLWKEVYAFKEIANKFGITRRQHKRVPILAQFVGTNSKNQKITARVITISHGGLGVTDNFDLKLGETIQGQLTSPHFYTPLTIAAEVTYSGLDGYAGLKFTQLNDEGQSIVSDYVKRFGKETESQ